LEAGRKENETGQSKKIAHVAGLKDRSGPSEGERGNIGGIKEYTVSLKEARETEGLKSEEELLGEDSDHGLETSIALTEDKLVVEDNVKVPVPGTTSTKYKKKVSKGKGKVK
jgi:hypothetical protein